MKGHHKKATGGAASGDPPEGEKLYEADAKDKPTRRNNAPKIEGAAEEMKHGGHAKRKKRKHGGKVKHHEKMGEMKHAHHIGKVHGHKGGGHKGKMARGGTKSGSNFNPLSSAHAGTAPMGHKDTDID